MLRFVTTNAGKLREAREYLGDVEQLDYDYTEIQSDGLGAIAARGARDAHAHATAPVIVDDAGLFVDGLGGFPGPYSSYVEDTLGIERVHRLAAAEPGETQRAAFRCVVAFCDGDPVEAALDEGHATDRTEGSDRSDRREEPPVGLFEGVVRGRIVAPRGEGGFGYDPIFEHDGATLAEMSTAEKNAISHRGRTLAAFAEWYADR